LITGILKCDIIENLEQTNWKRHKEATNDNK
jgi:hypothetical protein